MPIYEYSCKKCGKKVELLQKMGTNEAGRPCPVCGEDALVKVLSVTSPSRVEESCAVPNHKGACGGCCGGCRQ